MDLSQTSNATIMLYMKQDEDEGKTPVVIEEQETRSMDMSAALALRHSGTPACRTTPSKQERNARLPR